MATTLDETVQFRAKARRVAVWTAGAAAEDVTLSEFMRRAADAYARRVLTVPEPGDANPPASERE